MAKAVKPKTDKTSTGFQAMGVCAATGGVLYGKGSDEKSAVANLKTKGELFPGHEITIVEPSGERRYH